MLGCLCGGLLGATTQWSSARTTCVEVVSAIYLCVFVLFCLWFCLFFCSSECVGLQPSRIRRSWGVVDRRQARLGDGSFSYERSEGAEDASCWCEDGRLVSWRALESWLHQLVRQSSRLTCTGSADIPASVPYHTLGMHWMRRYVSFCAKLLA